jgi:hypothetical protein
MCVNQALAGLPTGGAPGAGDAGVQGPPDSAGPPPIPSGLFDGGLFGDAGISALDPASVVACIEACCAQAQSSPSGIAACIQQCL